MERIERVEIGIISESLRSLAFLRAASPRSSAAAAAAAARGLVKPSLIFSC